MAKTAPLKRKGSWIFRIEVGITLLIHFLGQSLHSRAAKRASSPSIDTDKSLKDVKPPAESVNFRPSVLAIHRGAGVTKKQKHGRKSVLSSKAKRRQERGLDRAEAVMDKIEKKIEKSRGKARTVQERSKAWDELNRKMVAKKAREAALALEKENWVDKANEEDQEMKLDAAVVGGVKDLDITYAPPVGCATTPASAETAEEEEIL
jgi:hypothetical protein